MRAKTGNIFNDVDYLFNEVSNVKADLQVVRDTLGQGKSFSLPSGFFHDNCDIVYVNYRDENNNMIFGTNGDFTIYFDNNSHYLSCYLSNDNLAGHEVHIGLRKF